MEEVDVLIVGAGWAGLSCARTLKEAGKTVLVLDRSGQSGGRAATKAVGSAVLDFGPVFVHGDDPDFLAWVETSGPALVPGWPRVVEGRGTPCQPQAFDPRQQRFAVVGGLRTLAEALASGLEVTCGAEVESLAWEEDAFTAACSDGRRFRGRDVVLALATDQARELMDGVSGPGVEALRGPRALLAQFSGLPCLTVLADYGPGVAPPAWDVCYPEASPALLLVSHETTKRPPVPGAGPSLVFQARPSWSAARLEADRDSWARDLLGEAAALLGPWAARPVAWRTHRWKSARLGPSDHLVRPVVVDRPGSSARIGLAGDLFDPDGGLQGAWRSGRALARRLAGGPGT